MSQRGYGSKGMEGTSILLIFPRKLLYQYQLHRETDLIVKITFFSQNNIIDDIPKAVQSVSNQQPGFNLFYPYGFAD